MRVHNLTISGSFNAQSFFQAPYGSSNNRPSSPQTGSLFYNTTDDVLEVFTGWQYFNGWRAVSDQGS